jgi:hypothetical protein
MKGVQRFQIILLLPILSLLMGCATGSPVDWRIAFYKSEATQTEFVTDYKECEYDIQCTDPIYNYGIRETRNLYI